MSRSIDRARATRALALATAASAFGFVGVWGVNAATLNWDNQGGDNAWNTAANWNLLPGNTDALPGATDTAVFIAASNFTSGTTFNVTTTPTSPTTLGISIGNGNTSTTTGQPSYVPNFNVSGSALKFKGRVLGVDANNAAVTTTGNNGGTDGGTVLQVKTQALTGAPVGVSVGTYSFANDIILSVNGSGADPNFAIQSSNATVALSGDVSTDNTTSPIRGGLLLYGGGTLSLSNAANTYTGNTTVVSGTLLARKSASNDATPSVFGTSTSVILLGNPTGNSNQMTGSNAVIQLLASDGANIARNINVVATAQVAGTTSIGGGTTGTTPATFSGQITLNRPALLRSNGDGVNTVDFTGQILSAGANAATNGITKTQPGTVRLSNTSNSYQGATTISAGTLLLGNSGVIPNSSNLVMNGGTLATGGFNEVAGTLGLLANSSIDFNNASILSLAGPSLTAWTSGATLQLLNWNGSVGGFGASQFIVGGTPLNGDQLAVIDFVNPAGFDPGTYDATQLPGGEIVPVPEPVGLGLIAAVAVPLLGRRRRAETR